MKGAVLYGPGEVRYDERSKPAITEPMRSQAPGRPILMIWLAGQLS
jgi:hypothetical protein